MPVSICIYSNVVKQGQFFSFIMYKESYLKIFEYFILNVHLIAPISPPHFCLLNNAAKHPFYRALTIHNALLLV